MYFGWCFYMISMNVHKSYDFNERHMNLFVWFSPLMASYHSQRLICPCSYLIICFVLISIFSFKWSIVSICIECLYIDHDIGIEKVRPMLMHNFFFGIIAVAFCCLFWFLSMCKIIVEHINLLKSFYICLHVIWIFNHIQTISPKPFGLFLRDEWI